MAQHARCRARGGPSRRSHHVRVHIVHLGLDLAIALHIVEWARPLLLMQGLGQRAWAKKAGQLLLQSLMGRGLGAGLRA